MSGVSSQLRNAKMAGAGFIVILALAIIGFVWLSLSAVAALRVHLSGAAPELIVGLICLAPLVVFLIRQRMKASSEHLHAQPAHAELAHISQIAQGMVEKSPLTALAIAALAGVLAVRFPTALTLLLQVLNPQRTT
jgi:hypothetical protein